MSEWGQTIICKPGDDEEFLYSIMEGFQQRRAEERGERIVNVERKKLDPGIAREMYDLSEGSWMLGLYVQTEPQ